MTFSRAAEAERWLARQHITDRPFQDRGGEMYERAQLRQLALDQQREQLAEKLAESIAFERADSWTKSVLSAKAALNAELPEREARRHAEHELSAYVREKVLPLCTDLDESNELANWCTCATCCRINGTVGALPDGELVTMWDYKCGKSRLCPDEAREEMMRLAGHYAPQIAAWAERSPDHRVFYLVLTFPHGEPGRLHHHLRYLPQRFVDLILDGKRECTEADREAFGYSKRKKKVHRFRPGFDAPRDETAAGYTGAGIQGALLVTECPLSRDGRWNVHLNVLLLVKGRFDYKELYDAWRDGAEHINVEIDQVDARDPYELACAVREVIKYAAAHTGTKSAEKAAQGSKAPPMTAWPPELWLEWYRAHKDYRRCRAYGCLYNAPDESPEQDVSQVTWLGRIKLDDAGAYWVDLIPDDKFSRPRGFEASDDYFPPPHGPPRPPGAGRSGEKSKRRG